MLTLLIYVIVTCIVALGLVYLIDKVLPSKIRPIVSILLWIICAFVAYLIYASVMKPINFEKDKDVRYEAAVNKLLDIKKAQMGYKAVHKQYADSFDKLVSFIENEKFAIVSRKDTAVIDVAKNRAFGIVAGPNGEGGFFLDKVIIDTLGHVSVRDSLFKNSDRYKRLNVVKVGEVEVPVKMQVGSIPRNETLIPVFKAEIDKNLLLSDLDQELVEQENKVESIDEINGPTIILGSLDEAVTTGNWPKKYGKND